MKTIMLNLSYEHFSINGSYKNDWGITKKFDGFKVTRLAGQRVYIIVMSGNLKLSEIAKKLIFEDGKVFITFGKQKINIGTYE